jgi:hypothetical protein
MIILTVTFLFYCIISVASNDLENEPIRVTGQGYHRKLEIELGTTEMKNALLKWEITPDFYVDVYELKRLGFEFRVDGGQTPFIEIEEPSHKSSFHSLSLNIHKANNSIPFHLRYQPAVYSDEFYPYTSILLPGPELHLIGSDLSVTKFHADPFEFKIPAGNRNQQLLVDISTLFSVFVGTVYLGSVILRQK